MSEHWTRYAGHDYAASAKHDAVNASANVRLDYTDDDTYWDVIIATIPPGTCTDDDAIRFALIAAYCPCVLHTPCTYGDTRPRA